MPTSLHIPLYRRLAFQQVLLIMAVALAVSLVLGSLQFLQEIEDQRHGLEHEVELFCTLLQGPAAQAAFNLDRRQAREIVEALLQHPAVWSVALVDDFHSPLALGKVPEKQVTPTFLEELLLGEVRELHLELDYEPAGHVGVLQVTMGYLNLGEGLRQRILGMLFFDFAKFLLLALIVGLVVYRSVIKPIMNFSTRIRRIDPSQPQPLQLDIPLAQRRNELGLMMQTVLKVFNAYAVSFSRREKLEAQLQGMNRQLEEKITKRTQDLQQQTQLLRQEIADRTAAEESLTEQHAFLNALFENIKAGILVFDPHKGRVVEVNSVVHEMLQIETGTDLEQACAGQPVLFTSHKRSYDILCPETEDVPSFAEGSLTLPDGRIIPVARHQFPVHLMGHEHIVQIIFDITEEKNLERQLGIAQRLESIGLLAAGIAHEINTPIQYIGDSISFMKESAAELTQLLEEFKELLQAAEQCPDLLPLVERIKEIIEEMDLPFLLEQFPRACNMAQGGVQHISGIVLAMKNFSHAGSEEMKPTDINKALETTAVVARNEWKYVAELELDLDPELPLVDCLPGGMNQVFLNILVNAAHAIKDVVTEGETKGRIGIATRVEGDHAVITFRDSGCGMTPETMNKIFDPFFTTKEVGKGTGQGLAIVHDIVVNKHNGSITVDSQPGLGSVFEIRIPFLQPDNRG